MTKRNLVFGILLISLISFGYSTYAFQFDDPCQRTILTVLAPKIQEEINKYYKNKLTVSPTFAPYLGGNRVEFKTFTSHIDVNVTLIPYVGPHLDVGKDMIKFQIDNNGNVEVINYNHIEDYKLLPNWQHIIK
ncbi:DUF3888 domain-containing protein [Paenibacillus sepulcri]|uniref:DUF3888 domain-containing protein n=1 Tax=Paenibacillus sepulcri TaxID=359917 RepID=A0ABS7CI07_9BACL|nr:DUF3888 domain-containing protein [Paenibacillus sepulcri]